MSPEYVDFMTRNPLFQQMVRENMAKAWTESQAEGRIEDGIEHAHWQILKLLQYRFSGTLLGLAKQRLGDIQDIEVLNALLDATLIGNDSERVQTLLEEHSPPRHGGRVDLFTESILSAVRSHYSEMLLEFTKRLGRIQDVEALEKIEQAALVSDIQRVLSLVRANDPTE